MSLARLVGLAALLEAVTGLALLAAPGPVNLLLLGAEATGVAAAGSRIAGAALVARAIACWPGRGAIHPSPAAARAMIVYSSLAAMVLLLHGALGGAAGPLLWPGVGLHSLLLALLGAARVREGRAPPA